MPIRCKFRCVEVTKRTHWAENRFLYVAKFSAVTGGSPEDKAFFDATPSGSLEIGTYKEDHFRVGGYYYLDVSPAPEDGG